MIKYILIIFGVISIVIIAKIIINKRNNKEEEKEIEFNEFDDLEKIKQKKKDKEQIENELKALEKIRQEKEYSEFIKKDKEWEQKYLKNGKKLEYKKDIQQIILDSVDSIKKKIKTKEKRKKTEILENFNPEKENKIYEGSEINEINENYNNFNLDLFKKWSEGIFLCIEIGEKKELELIKKCILPEMYNRLIKNANELNKDGLKLQREEIFIEEIKLIDYGKNIRKEEIKIFIKAQMKEYIKKIKNEKVVRGSREKIKEKNIIMTFHKKREDLEQEGFIESCENCGASISQTEFGKCKYCESIVLPIRYNWVLVKFQII